MSRNLREALNDVVGDSTWRPDNTLVIHDAEKWATLVGYIVMATNGDNDGQVPMGCEGAVAEARASLDFGRLTDLRDAIIEAVQTQDGIGAITAFAAYDDFIEAEARASLDVERVARGVWTWRYGDRAWRDGGEDERGSTYIAEHIAREYAAQWWLAHQPDPFGEDRPLLDALRAALEEPTDD